MTASANRSAATESAAAERQAAHCQSEPAATRCPGTYTDRHDRPHAAPRPEGTYVSGGKRRSSHGSYTDVDGARGRTGRTEGYYTLRD